jgi:hypothetical protein
MEISIFATIASFTHLYPRLLVRLYVAGSVALIALGAWSICSRHRARALLLLGPLAAGAGASVVGAYPIAVRLWVFAAPLIVALLVAGILSIARRLSEAQCQSLAVATVLLIGLPVASVSTWGLFWPTFRREHSRPIVEAIRNGRAPGEPVYVYPSSTPAWLVYAADWAAPEESARIRAYARAASPPHGPAFINGRERVALTDATAATLERATGLGIEVFGTSSGVVIEYRDESDLEVFPGWADAELDRVLPHAPRCMWTFESHVEDPEWTAFDSALESRGFSLAQTVGDADARAAKFCRKASGASPPDSADRFASER